MTFACHGVACLLFPIATSIGFEVYTALFSEPFARSVAIGLAVQLIFVVFILSNGLIALISSLRVKVSLACAPLTAVLICLLPEHPLREMNTRNTSVTLLLPTALVLVFFGAAYVAINRDAQISIRSPSGRFILQSVPLAPWSDLAYLRITDTQNPQSVFRTPLYDKQYTDMRPHEDEWTVGTYWIDFDKQERTFEIGVPEWRDSWLNGFISNTPYWINEN